MQIAGLIGRIRKYIQKERERGPFAHYVSIMLKSKSTRRLRCGQQKRNEIHVVAGTGCKRQIRLTALSPKVEAERASRTGKGLAAVTIGARKCAKQTAEATEEIGAIIKQINGIADRIASVVGGGEVVAAGAARRLREMAVRLQAVLTGHGGPAIEGLALA
jgi:hypothetical protein